MSLEEEIEKILVEEDKERIKRYLWSILKPEKIELVRKEELLEYFVPTNTSRTLAKIIAASCKLKENIRTIITGPKGAGKTTILRYIATILKKRMNVEILNQPSKIKKIDSDCIFLFDNGENAVDKIISWSSRLDNIPIIVEMRPYWVFKGLENNLFNDSSWQILIINYPSENEIREIVRRRFNEVSEISRNPLLSLLLQIRGAEEIGLPLVSKVKALKGTKLRMLWVLTSSDTGMFLKVIAEKVEKSQATISRHLRELERENLITSERVGRKIFYKISYPAVYVKIEESIIEEINRRWSTNIFII
ncbi:MAG: helix-turn-helix domain-containing protein [Candidatus Njordarchaeales archaeon]